MMIEILPGSITKTFQHWRLVHWQGNEPSVRPEHGDEERRGKALGLGSQWAVCPNKTVGKVSEAWEEVKFFT